MTQKINSSQIGWAPFTFNMKMASTNSAAGNGANRVNPRTWQAAVTLSEGVNTISAGVVVTSATSPSVPSGGAQVSAVVLGNVTA